MTDLELKNKLSQSFCMGGLSTARQIRNILEKIEMDKKEIQEFLTSIEQEYATQLTLLIKGKQTTH